MENPSDPLTAFLGLLRKVVVGNGDFQHQPFALKVI
jgi:hypothetical protein